MSFDEQPDGDPHGECAAEIVSIPEEFEAEAMDERSHRDYLRRAYDVNTGLIDPSIEDEYAEDEPEDTEMEEFQE